MPVGHSENVSSGTVQERSREFAGRRRLRSSCYDLLEYFRSAEAIAGLWDVGKWVVTVVLGEMDVIRM